MMSFGAIKATLFLSAVLFVSSCNQSDPNDTSSEIVVVSYGGSFQEAQRKAYFEPFTEKTGIRVKEVQWSGEFAKLKAMVQSGNVSWDLVTAAEASIVQRGITEGLLEPINFDNIDESRFIPEAITEYSLGTNYYSTVLAFRSDDFIDQEKPTDWKDFWDVEKFPGPRSLRRDPRTTLEFALLADGVMPEDLYPLDVDRAFESLDKIAPHVSVWWSTGSQPVQLLANKEVVMTSVFNGRVWAAEQNEGLPFEVSWNGGALDVDTWIIPKGTKNYDAAMELVEFTAQPDIQFDLTQYISYSPTMPEAFEGVSPDLVADFPTAPQNFPLQFVYDGKWWAENEESVRERWDDWMIRNGG